MILVGGSAPGASDNEVAREAGVPAMESQDSPASSGLVGVGINVDWPSLVVALGRSGSGDERRNHRRLLHLDPEQKLFELEKLMTRTQWIVRVTKSFGVIVIREMAACFEIADFRFAA